MINKNLRKPYISNEAKYYAHIDAGFFHKAVRIQDWTTVWNPEANDTSTEPNIKHFQLNFRTQPFSIFCQVYIHIFKNLNLFINDAFEQVNSLTNEKYNYFDHEYVCSTTNKLIHIVET